MNIFYIVNQSPSPFDKNFLKIREKSLHHIIVEHHIRHEVLGDGFPWPHKARAKHNGQVEEAHAIFTLKLVNSESCESKYYFPPYLQIYINFVCSNIWYAKQFFFLGKKKKKEKMEIMYYVKA